MANVPYSKKVMDLFLNPKNLGEIENPDAQATEGAIENYEERNGLTPKDQPTDESLIKERLRGVIDPNTGKDLISSKILSNIAFENGKLTIHLNLKDTSQFANAIKEEIIEKFQYRWDVKSIEVKFLE